MTSKNQVAALNFIARHQAADGGFTGLAATTMDFQNTVPRPTIFYAALIMLCLRNVAGSERILEAAAKYLLSNRSDTWTWNYWQRDCSQFTTEPYPDDLDDTAVALAALYSHDPELVDGSAQGFLAQALIEQEVIPGGPYRTWLHNDPQWHDVDIAVNANVGFCLKLLGVSLPQLQDYVTEVILGGSFTSAYYVGDIPTLYFISRYYAGPETATLRDCLARASESPELATNPLLLAMTLSSAVRLQIPRSLVTKLRRQLVAMRQDDHWPAAALYLEPPLAGSPRYAGSAALSTAFALEALQLYNDTKGDVRSSRDSNHLSSETQPLDIPKLQIPTDLKRQYQTALKQTLERDHDKQITGVATSMAHACQAALAPQILTNLNLASLHGWIAYTAYDDILDAETEAASSLLSMANFALRQSLQYFGSALPAEPSFQSLIHQTLDTVDGANTWEVLHARGTLVKNELLIEKLPDYGNYAQLWQRSAGHLLAMRGVLLAAGNPLQDRAQQQFSRFFKHCIIARQLNDDAHDWESDLRRGQLSAVVTMLLHDYYGSSGMIIVDLEHAVSNLQAHFWENTILEVCRLIEHHVMLAERALQACPAIREPAELLRWLEPLRHATERVHHERAEAQKFIRAYAQSSP